MAESSKDSEGLGEVFAVAKVGQVGLEPTMFVYPVKSRVPSPLGELTHFAPGTRPRAR